MTHSDHDIDQLYGLLMEGHMELMYLPSGAIAWLFDRPEEQVHAAAQVGVECRRHGCEIVDSALLRSDRNVLILTTKTNVSIKVYPGGWYGVGDQSYADISEVVPLLNTGMVADEPVDDLPDPHPGEGGGEVEDYQYATRADLGGMTMDDMAFDIPKDTFVYGDLDTEIQRKPRR